MRISDRWMYLFRAVDSGGQTVDFYLSETRSGSIPIIDLRTYSQGIDCEVIPPRFENRRRKATSVIRADIEPAATQIIASNPITGM